MPFRSNVSLQMHVPPHSARLPSLLIAVSLALCSCSFGRVTDRMDFWSAATSAHLPPGTPLTDAKNFFSSQGLELKCCVRGPDIDNAYFARERKVGRSLLVEYDVAILVDVSKDERIERVRVQRWGVGL
jgi:hypothetical protein